VKKKEMGRPLLLTEKGKGKSKQSPPKINLGVLARKRRKKGFLIAGREEKTEAYSNLERKGKGEREGNTTKTFRRLALGARDQKKKEGGPEKPPKKKKAIASFRHAGKKKDSQKAPRHRGQKKGRVRRLKEGGAQARLEKKKREEKVKRAELERGQGGGATEGKKKGGRSIPTIRKEDYFRRGGRGRVAK